MSEILFHLAGRLGNQLFQYAYAHQLSIHFGKSITFFFDKYHHPTSYEWGVTTQMGPCGHIKCLKMSNAHGLSLKVSDSIYSRSEPLFHLVNKSLNIVRSMDAFELPSMPKKPPSLVTGFFINASCVRGSPIFTQELEEHLIRRVNVDRLKVKRNYELFHVRGSDLKESIYGALGREYYRELPDSGLPRYVITDDLSHAKSILAGIDVAQFFSPEEVNPWEAIKLMQGAKVFIASNSTLAWWGAYLCLKRGGEAVIPKPFYKGNLSSSELLHIDGFVHANATFD